MPEVRVRKEMPGVELSREQFSQRMQQQFSDPAFDTIRGDVERIIEAAWQGYSNNRKSPHTRPAGQGYARPNYELSVEWTEASRRAEGGRAPAERPRFAFAHPSHQWRGAQ